MMPRLVLAIVIGLLAFLGTRLARLLTPGGACAAGLLAALLVASAPWWWMVPMLLFFLSSSALSKVAEASGEAQLRHFEKGNERDAAQVLANGGVAGCVALAAHAGGGEPLLAAYLGALAAATADTWGTEIGMLSRSSVFLVPAMRRVEAGTSGGVSLPGILGGCAGSFVIGASGAVWSGEGILRLSVIAAAAGLAGSLVDSLLGATLQAQFRCGACGLVTERREHCGAAAVRTRGIGWCGNDLVNLACTLAGAAAGLLLGWWWV